MKRFIQPTSILLYILSILVFLLVGMFYASLSGAADGQGLAGGAIVLGNGIVFALIAFIAALLYNYLTNPNAVKLANKVLGVLLLLLIAIVLLRYYKTNKPDTTATIEANRNLKTTIPLDSQSLQLAEEDNKTPMGLGFFVPNFYENSVMYFYGQPNLQKSITDHTPYDSIVFKRLETGFEITYAPPWLYPDILKLDYDMLYFRVQSVGWDFAKVTVNISNQQLAYIDKSQGKILYWPDFLLGINSVEFIDKEKEQVRVRPFDYAGEVNNQYDFMKPLLIQDEWMEVILLDDGYKETGKGWIQWKRDGKLTISYSLLS